jgi:cytochrome P450
MKREYPAGPKINFPLAIARQMLPELFPFDWLAFALDVSRRYGDIAHHRLGPLRVYLLNSPEAIRQVLVEEREKFNKARFIKRGFGPFVGNGLFTSDGELWRRQRRLMQPTFQHNKLGRYGEIMVAHALRLMGSFRDGEIREINADMMNLTLGVVVKSLFGAEIKSGPHEIGALMMAVLDASNQRLNSAVQVPSWVPTRRNLREKRAVARIEALLRTLIEERRTDAGPRNDLLATLLAAVDEESDAGMSDRQLRDELMTLFLAGHETTANTLTWTWYLLSQHPEVESKLAAELSRVLDGRTPTAADLKRLPYTEMVVRESLRVYPPVTGFVREPIKEVRIGGYEIPRGGLVVANTYALHRDPRFFPDPERFDPQRFAAGWEERIPRYAYLPFGGGPRVCIGNGFAMMEAILVVATVAQRWRLLLEPDPKVVPVQLVTLRPKNGIRMRLRAT